MPFDQFFSSANKKHYVTMPPEWEAEYRRVMDLPQKERYEHIHRLIERAIKHDLDKMERFVLRKVQFIFQKSHRRVVRAVDDRKHKKSKIAFRCKRAKGQTVVVFSGYNTAKK